MDIYCTSYSILHHTANNLILPISQNAISDQWDEFQQLVLAVIQREVIPDVKALQREKFISSSPLYTLFQEIVTTLSQDLSWMQALTVKQNFYWGIIASCCEKIPISEKHFGWVHLYELVIKWLGNIYSSYCKWKELSEEEGLLSAERFPIEITHGHSEHIKR